VFVTDIDNSIREYVRYSTKQNFTGRTVFGYKTKRIVVTKEAAEALKRYKLNSKIMAIVFSFMMDIDLRDQ
jgi:D-alanyl-D-alanine dipeptidase